VPGLNSTQPRSGWAAECITASASRHRGVARPRPAARVNGKYQLNDLNSSNGTYINGTLINSRELAAGDEIQIGRTVMLYSVEPVRNETATVIEKVALLGEQEADNRTNIVARRTRTTARRW